MIYKLRGGKLIILLKVDKTRLSGNVYYYIIIIIIPRRYVIKLNNIVAVTLFDDTIQPYNIKYFFCTNRQHSRCTAMWGCVYVGGGKNVHFFIFFFWKLKIISNRLFSMMFSIFVHNILNPAFRLFVHIKITLASSERA